MPYKQFELERIGKVRLYKRRDSRSVKLTITADYIRVTLPSWLPYRAGIEFAKNKSEWIVANKKPTTVLVDGQLVGKYHRLRFHPTKSIEYVRASVISGSVNIYHPITSRFNAYDSQMAAKKAALKALKKEAENLLPVRLKELAQKHGYEYNSVKIRRLKSRWGSCSKNKEISLNSHLMQLPWELIDYVIIHELTHTVHLNHSKDFWTSMHEKLPNAKKMAPLLKNYQPSF